MDFLNKTVQGNDDKQPLIVHVKRVTAWHAKNYVLLLTDEITHNIYILDNKVSVQTVLIRWFTSHVHFFPWYNYQNGDYII